ncbi:MAG: hypothetical protein RIE73_12700 [Coleofasciculus sp. C1-SOL-03]|uniref:hypothetical protein n=1 Tax=Coleofasciculus sp. C1-SOL-03 TaxID=3069522 RepID=UPI003301D339
MPRIFVQLVIVTSLALSLLLTSIAPAEAMTVNFTWQGNQGYSATGTFNYDQKTAPAILSEKGVGTTQALESLTVSFADPSNHPIKTYNTINDGVSTGKYFQFNFNTMTQDIIGSIDVGGELPGDIYLKGKVDTDLSLIQISASGKENVIDSNLGTILVQSIRE